MKMISKLVLAFVLIAPSVCFAQKAAQQKTNAQNPSTDCYKEWYTTFTERGADPVTDGIHNIVVSIRNTSDGTSKCYMGKVEVSGGKIKPPIMVQKEDGSFDTFNSLTGKQLDPMFVKSMTEDELFAVRDGMSINMKSADMEYGRIFFYTFVSAKPKKLKEAPSPKSLIKN